MLFVYRLLRKSELNFVPAIICSFEDNAKPVTIMMQPALL